MKRIRIMGLCLVAVFAMTAVVTASASARTAERGVCKTAKKGEGVYENATCTIAHAKAGTKKEFVWAPQSATPAAFTSKTGAAKLKSFIGATELPAVECTKSKGKGKDNATTSTSIVTFEGCTSAGEKCTGGKKAKAGDIITFELAGTLGVISESGSTVGEDLVGITSATDPEGLSSEFKCGANEIKTRGSVIGEVVSVNQKANAKNKLIFAATGAAQDPENFEGGPKDTLETEINNTFSGGFFFTSVEETTAEVTGKSAETRLF